MFIGVSNSTRIALLSNNGSNSTNTKKLKEKKHQNLSLHLVNYSANPELNKTTLTLRAVQTFVNVAESDNPVIVSNCVIALSNISSHPHVRSLLVEINALHKLSNMMTAIKRAQAAWAAALLFSISLVIKKRKTVSITLAHRYYKQTARRIQGNFYIVNHNLIF